MTGKVLAGMLGSGVACAIMMWLSLWVVSGNLDPEVMVGGIVGGLLSGFIMLVLG